MPRFRLEKLISVGISGGLLPCPSALVMLLSASPLGYVGLGMTLVVAFSLGLAERAECDRINLTFMPNGILINCLNR
jgi:hypothetical protein